MKKFTYIFILLLCVVVGSSYGQVNKIRVTGKIVNKETRETLAGVSISTGNPLKVIATSDSYGNFFALVDINAVLVFTYAGSNPQSIKLKDNQTVLNVSVEVKNSKLDEVVIRGYVARPKKISTGASTTISGKEIQDVPVSNVEQLLQGKVAGMNVQVNTGAPGYRGSVQIRGLSTLSITGSGGESFLQPTSPLYIIDGIPIDADKAAEYGFQTQGPGISPTSLIPPEDIESIEVLKDAQSTSLYGSRAAYGVIVITTKRGNSVVPRVRYTTNFYVLAPPKLRATIGGNAERRLKMDQIIRNAQSPDDIRRISETNFLSDSLNAYFNNSTDWQSIFYQTTVNQTHNLAIDGGNQTFNYKTNLGYYGEKGVIKNTGFNRYSLNMNMEFKPSKKFRLFGSLFGALGKQKKGDGVGLLQTGVANNGQASSLLPPPSYYQASSGVVSALKTNNDNNSRNLRTNIDARYEFIPGLALSATLSYDFTADTEDNFKPAAANAQFAEVYAYSGRSYSLYSRNMLSYAKTIKTNHNIFVSAFSEIYKQGAQAGIIRQERTPNDQLQGPFGTDAYYSRGGGVLSTYRDSRIASFAGAFSYNFKNKYVLDLSYRMDGTSSSGMENPYSKNPAIGIRWNFQSENFMRRFKWLSNGNIRMSWGKNIIPSGSLQSIYGIYNINGTYNNNPAIGINYDQIPNPTLKPTTTVQYNLGYDLGFFGNRLELTFDTYFKQVDNILFDRNLSNITGFNRLVSNDAGIANYGYELALTGRIIRGPKVNWSISANGAINKDILTKLPVEYGGQYIRWDGNPNFSQHTLFRVGRNTLTNYLITNNGVYSTNANVPIDPVTGLPLRTNNNTSFHAGDPAFKDVNGDYVLDGNDYTASGNAQPMVTGGFSTNFTYKNFGVNLYASFTLKRTILNNALSDRLAIMRDPFALTSVVPLDNLDIWKQSGDQTRYPNPYDYARYNNIQPFRKDQTLWAENGSYLKLNNVTFFYTFNKDLIKRFGFYSMRVYVSTNNLMTFSKYSGPNPENVNSMGRDNSNGYPVPRTYNVGVNIDLNSGK